MHYVDLAPYDSCIDPEHPKIRTVGWLDGTHSYTKGPVEDAFTEKMRAVIESDYPRLYRFAPKRGYHFCELCPKSVSRDHRGACEILVPDITTVGGYFSAPALLGHYVTEHGYLPPEAFVHSVLAIDLSRDFDAVVAHHEIVMSAESMREMYEDEAEQAVRVQVGDQYTEKQRESVRNGEHLRYAKWLSTHCK